MKSSGNAHKPPTNESLPSTVDSNALSEPSSYVQPDPDPLERLEELLDSENFDGDRISVVINDPPRSGTSERPSLIKQLGRKHPRVALVLTVVVAGAVWVKVLAELFETLH